jgi:hypothetical protein
MTEFPNTPKIANQKKHLKIRWNLELFFCWILLSFFFFCFSRIAELGVEEKFQIPKPP